MINLTEKIKNSYSDNKYREALHLVEEFLEQDLLSSSEECELIEKVFDCQPDIQFKLKKQYLEKTTNKNLIRINFLNTTLEQVSKVECFHLFPSAKLIFLSLGELERLEILFYKIKKELLRFKSYAMLLSEVEELENSGLENLLTSNEKIEINYGLFNISFFRDAYEFALASGKSPFKISNTSIDLNLDVWRKQTFAVKEKILSSSKFDTIDEAKDFLKGIYELLIVDNETGYALYSLLSYCKKFGNKKLATVCLELLQNNYSVNRSIELYQVNEIEEVVRSDFGEIDLGEDLFSSNNEDKDLSVRRLENQIQLLKKQNDSLGITKLLKELRDIDEDHSLVKDLEEKKHGELGSKIKVFKKSISEIEQELIKELMCHTTHNQVVNDEIVHLERVCKKFVELSSSKFLKENYSNLIYTFNTLGFYKVSITLINLIIIEIDEKAIKLKIELIYLKCETLILSKNLYGALNEIEEFLDIEPLTSKEKINFLYLKAEVLRKLGKKSEALKVYSKVYHINKKYRMVSNRLKEIE